MTGENETSMFRFTDLDTLENYYCRLGYRDPRDGNFSTRLNVPDGLGRELFPNAEMQIEDNVTWWKFTRQPFEHYRETEAVMYKMLHDRGFVEFVEEI